MEDKRIGKCGDNAIQTLSKTKLSQQIKESLGKKIYPNEEEMGNTPHFPSPFLYLQTFVFNLYLYRYIYLTFYFGKFQK